MLSYPKDAINATINWIQNSEDAKNWLQKNNFEELVKLKTAAIGLEGYKKALEYLLVQKHLVLAAFVNAIWDDKDAFALLMEKKEVVWAAMSNFINGDEKAALFLKKNKLDHYLQLAHVIQQRIRKEGDKGSNFFNSGPYKV